VVAGFELKRPQVPAALAINFTGLAASLSRGKEGNWRGARGLCRKGIEGEGEK
jgi:hypothetical protein